MALIWTPESALSSGPEEKLTKVIQHYFGFDVTGRVKVLADRHHFTTEDKSVWEQMKGKRPDYFEAYWDDVWMCDFTLQDDPLVVGSRFMKGFVKAYEKNEIGIRTRQEIEHDVAEKEIQRAIDEVNAKKINNEAEQIEKEVIVGLLEDKKPSRKKKK